MVDNNRDKSKHLLRRPEETSLDNVYRNVKILLSAIPGIGGSAAELFSSIIVPPISKRRDEWIESIAEGQYPCFCIHEIAATILQRNAIGL